MSRQVITLSSNSSWYLFNFRRSTIKRLLKDDFKVICISPKDNFTDHLINLGCEWKEIKVSRKGLNPLQDLSLFFKIYITYLKLKPVAAFHFTVKNNIYGSFAAFLARVPAINNITGLGTAFLQRNFISRVVTLLYKLSQPLADTVFCQNSEDINMLESLDILSKDQIKLLPGSGVDLKRFNPSIKLQVDESKKKFRFLYAGRMLSDKGLNELFEAISSINNFQVRCELWLCGFIDHENVSAISEETLNNWNQSKWLFWLGQSSSIENIMSQVDCIVLPSYREGMPKSLLEAGAMAIPVVTTDVPGCNTIISHEVNGLICKPKDAISLEAALNSMLEMTDVERQEMGNRGREIVKEKYDEEIVIQSALDAVYKIIDI